jgi:Skp family chaperone for outer membrane proteins
MSTIKQIRDAIDTKLDKWEAQATALEAQLELNKAQVLERVEAQKSQLEQIAQSLREKIDATSGFSNETKTKITASFQRLQVQLALGAADTRDTYQQWKQKLQSCIAGFEADLDLVHAKDDAALQTKLDALLDDYVREADALEAEIEAMQAQFNEDKARAKADYEKYKNDLQSKIDAYKSELEKTRKVGTGKLEKFETELSAGATQIKNAFSNLFS